MRAPRINVVGISMLLQFAVSFGLILPRERATEHERVRHGHL
jgi:hypothetical protein